MKIKMRWKHDIRNGATIQEFARMEMHPTMPNHVGVYVDHVTVPIASVSGWLFLLHVALGNDGYHVSTEYETPSGGGGVWLSTRSRAYKTKKEAFEAGIKDLLKREYLRQFTGYINRALPIFHAASYVQLTLF